jgi:hypothetical protein
LGHDALALISSGCARLVGQLAHRILSFHHCQMLDRLNCTSNRTGLKNQQNRPVPVLENRPVLIKFDRFSSGLHRIFVPGRILNPYANR